MAEMTNTTTTTTTSTQKRQPPFTALWDDLLRGVAAVKAAYIELKTAETRVKKHKMEREWLQSIVTQSNDNRLGRKNEVRLFFQVLYWQNYTNTNQAEARLPALQATLDARLVALCRQVRAVWGRKSELEASSASNLATATQLLWDLALYVIPVTKPEDNTRVQKLIYFLGGLLEGRCPLHPPS
jgi:hypothetical protein